MPEGHSVHRIARQFQAHFVGHRATVTSPQGRFADGAAQLDGLTMTDALAVGKQLFLEFAANENAPRKWMRVHLGIYGAWDFAGDVSMDPAALSAGGRIGQTGMKGVPSGAGTHGENENSLASIGAPRRTRLRMAETEKETELTEFPPEPVGQVRVRILTDTAVADLRGPTACEVLEPEDVAAVIAKFGPDPQVDPGQDAEDRFVETVRKKRTPIGLLLMDQSVVAGIGNVYRAELLFRARLNPHTPGNTLPDDVIRSLWRDWAHLLDIGVRTGQMLTMDDLDPDAYARALAHRDDRHWVYRRAGLPCRVCGTHIVMELAAARKLYWCPSCQA